MKALVIVLGALAALVVGTMLVAQSEWAERRVESFAAERLGREVDVENMRLRATWPPQMEIGALRVANPAWAQEPFLIDAHGMRASVQLGALFRGRVVATVALDEAALALEKREGENTWSFGQAQAEKKEPGGEPSPFELRSASIGALRIAYRDAPDETEIVARASGDLGREGRPFEASAEGRVRGEEIKARASAPAVPLEGAQPVELKFEVELAGTHTAGTLALRAAEQRLQSIEGTIEASGPSVEAFENITRGDLPGSAPYKLSAHVRHEDGRWSVDKLDLRLGKSDVRGSVLFDASRKPPFLRAQLQSDFFDLEETGIKQEVKEELQEKYLIPRDPWPVDKLEMLDAEVELSIKKVRNARPVPLDALEVRAVLENSSLSIDPFAISLANGTIKGKLALDGSESPERGSALVDIRGLRLSRLFPALKGAESALGRLNGHIELSGRGDTPARMLGSASGQILFAAQGGTANGLLVELMGLDAAEAVRLLGKRNVKQPLKCAVMNLQVKNGTAKTAPFVVDATDTVLSVEGTVNLGKETLALTARAEPRDASPFTLRTPADIGGTFLDPQVKPHKGPLVARGAAAIALGAINPLLALVPFVDPGGDPEPGCRPQKK